MAVLLVLVVGAILIYNAAKPAAQEGGKNIVVTVVHGDGSEKEFKLSTDAETLRAALEEKSLIEGTESEYGLYVTSVCGMELVWSEENPHYWAFYIDGEYAQTGVDTTPVAEGSVYLFKAE